MAVINATLPSLYEYYTGGGITAGLSASQPYFTLNNRNITIYSGAMHYFRIPKQYWRDRLRKLRAAGLNTVETYVPWNLHEPTNGSFHFGERASDMEEFLDVQEYLRIAQEEDLLAIVRPGPYICSEWEFGGFPSWLLREKNIKLRTSDNTFMKYVTRYFNMLLPILAALQFTKGGPIIAFQVENEYGSTKSAEFTPDKVYLRQLRNLMMSNNITELLVTSDSAMSGTVGTLPEVFLMTANFASDPETQFDALKQLQKNRPSMAMEYWTGWFDHWSEEHHTRDDIDFYYVLERILKYPASVNMYMFHGGTNWGFLNGANNVKVDNSANQPDTTSYDYDAPLTESGNYTLKYAMVRTLLHKYNSIKTRTPAAPAMTPTTQYSDVSLQEQMLLGSIINNINTKVVSPKLLSMELLPINGMSGQSYGYIIYRKTNLDLAANSIIKIAGHVCDSVVVLINGILLSKPLIHVEDLNGFGFWRLENSSIILTTQALKGVTLDLVVENWGRNNFGELKVFNQFKGLWQGGVYINNVELVDWEIFPLEFQKSWTNSLSGWHSPIRNWVPGPSLYKFTFQVDDVQDTYIDMQEWTKGVVTINGFVLGRFAKIGPQQTLYLPAPLIKKGNNTIVIFEHYIPGTRIKFSSVPIYKTAKRTIY